MNAIHANLLLLRGTNRSNGADGSRRARVDPYNVSGVTPARRHRSKEHPALGAAGITQKFSNAAAKAELSKVTSFDNARAGRGPLEEGISVL